MARWNWPEEVKRLSDWMGARALRDFTSDPKPTSNTIYGRKIAYEEEGKARRGAVLERRDSIAGEAGKYQYRFVCARSLKRFHKNLLSTYEMEVKDIGLKVYGFPSYSNYGCPLFCIRSRYHPAIPPAFKRFGGVWDAEYRVWTWHDAEHFHQAWEFLHEFYRFDDGRFFDVCFSLEALLPELFRDEENVWAMSKQLLWCRSKDVRTGTGVWFYDPTGSYQDLGEICVIATNIPSSLYEQHDGPLADAIINVTTHEPDTLPENVCRRLPRTLFPFPEPVPIISPFGSPFGDFFS